MILSLKAISPDASLNTFIEVFTFQFVSGSDLELMFVLWQNDKKIRYIPSASATTSLTLKKSDGTTITKTGSFAFSDDRSVIKFTLSEAETVNLISQNVTIKLDEGSITTYAILEKAIQRYIPTCGI